jgi:hypothetical protein
MHAKIANRIPSDKTAKKIERQAQEILDRHPPTFAAGRLDSNSTITTTPLSCAVRFRRSI